MSSAVTNTAKFVFAKSFTKYSWLNLFKIWVCFAL